MVRDDERRENAKIQTTICKRNITNNKNTQKTSSYNNTQENTQSNKNVKYSKNRKIEIFVIKLIEGNNQNTKFCSQAIR